MGYTQALESIEYLDWRNDSLKLSTDPTATAVEFISSTEYGTVTIAVERDELAGIIRFLQRWETED